MGLVRRHVVEGEAGTGRARPPPVPVELLPPPPALAVWSSVRVPPVVVPVTALVSVLLAPAPPLAPPEPLPAAAAGPAGQWPSRYTPSPSLSRWQRHRRRQ